MVRRINRFVAAVLLLGAQGPTFAAQHAHVHGIAKLQVAVDGPTLTLVLSSPLDNLLGFEHAPRTAKEKAAAADLTARLGKPETLLVPSPAAGCTVASAKVDAPTLEGHSAAKSAARGTTAAPAHSEKAGHDHGEHSDVTAEYVFRCQRPEDLRGLEVKLFEPFRRLRHVEAQVVGPKGQSATKLTPAKRQLSW